MKGQQDQGDLFKEPELESPGEGPGVSPGLCWGPRAVFLPQAPGFHRHLSGKTSVGWTLRGPPCLAQLPRVQLEDPVSCAPTPAAEVPALSWLHPGWACGQCPSVAPGLIACPSPQGVEQDALQAIDRAIEAVHNAAMREGGKYSLEQRGVLQ